MQLSQLHKRINTGKTEIGPQMVDMIASLLLEQAYDHQGRQGIGS